ncbi:uncharacterized protein LOC127736247 [Mytilus californianus]|uniref:uncharacterized protein LOC127736247 n=1 Tax=Mytilus californianus TaxID=6549 RepID=UPI002246A250|nr:uncharacterized protein LOC127736247 [Mytilus californianus]
MKELFISIIALVFFIAAANGQKLNNLPKYYKEKLLRKIKHSLSPEEITIIEKFNNLKDFYPDGERHHVLRKRNAVQSMGEAQGTSLRKKRKRRRRKQKPSIKSSIDRSISPSPNEPRNGKFEHPRGRQGRRPRPSDQPSIKSSIDGPINPSPYEPRNDILDKHRGRQGRQGQQKRIIPSAVIQEAPVLSEANEEDNDGLLKVKELNANYISTDNMRTNTLKADEIKADRVKAQKVVVTSKKPKRKQRRLRRPRLKEFIDPSIGMQRINSRTDIPYFDKNFANKHDFRQFELLTTEPRSMYRKPSLLDSQFFQQQSVGDNSQMFQQPKIADKTQLFQQQHISDGRYLRPAIETKRRLSQFNQPPPLPPTDILPEFSSSNILKKIPALSEFIADDSQKGNNQNVIQQDTLLRGAPPPVIPSAFDEFTNMDAQNYGKGGNTDQTPDKTAKTYMKNSKSTDPWYF